jgi:hypothetical protein
MNDKRRAPNTHAAATNEEDGLPNDLEGEEYEDESEDEEDAAPGVVMGRLRDLGGVVDPALVKQYGDLPVWFLIEDDAELVELFDRIPERPLPQKPTQGILGALRQFAASEADALQELLGPTDTIGLGFHASAKLDEVIESFEDDGFEVLLGLEGGKVRFEEE